MSTPAARNLTVKWLSRRECLSSSTSPTSIVIHCFFLLAFRLKMDAVPNTKIYSWLFADKVGEYDIMCTEYCNVGHSGMTSKTKDCPGR